MRAFAELLERLAFSPGRRAKLRLLADHLAGTPDPDRGWAIAAIAGDLGIATVRPAMLRALVADRIDPVLFALSYDYVGDLAETIALVWGPAVAAAEPPALGAVIDRLAGLSRTEARRQIADWLDRMEPPARLALLKLVTGGLRVGVSAGLVRTALAAHGRVDAAEIEALWHGLAPPYRGLFDWLEGRGPRPLPAARAPFRPVMLATALDEAGLDRLAPADFLAEWKWDGIRVQASLEQGTRRLYARSGEDIGRAFPDLLEALGVEGTLDGELLVGRPGPAGIEPGSFAELQQRLNRRTVPARLMASHPAVLRAYDLLVEGAEDLRPLPFAARRARLEALAARLDPARIDLSPLVPFADWETLGRLRAAPPHPAIEGVMLKRRDAPYLAGRPKGPWFKWKKAPHSIDAVLMYASRGHGRRSGYYSDYTFGVWGRDDALVPVGKAYSGFTDEELRRIDRHVRENTVGRYGPVRAVRAEPDAGLVLEIAFEGLARSTRHRSGVAMRFPRILRLRWDKPPAEADRLETLERLLG